jgi:hypothetical protein
VNNDLVWLQKACCKLLNSFTSALDLAKFVKDYYVIRNMSNVRLSDLTTIVLQKHLDKNTPLHTSELWENQVLTSEQVSYAAKDAYALLVIYNKLADHYIVPAPIPATSPPLTPVLLYSSNLNHIIAEGHLSILYPHLLEIHNGIEILHGHALVDIHHVVVPGAIVSAHHK